MSAKGKKGGGNSASKLSLYRVYPIIITCVCLWLRKVSKIVPEPYLDEVFHVRQAQVYCSGDFQTWDSKITTPPGLYLISWLIFKSTGYCSIEVLRALNAFTLLVGPFVAHEILLNLQEGSQASSNANALWITLTSINVWLFPPLLFFSALYYTDVQSALWVLASFLSFQRYQMRGFTYGTDAFLPFIFGVLALLFRQTNIFWVAVFPAGLAVVEVARKASLNKRAPFNQQDTSFLGVLQSSWADNALYNPPVDEAGLEDYLKVALSIGLISFRNINKLIPVLAPYVALLASFGAFVFWNGGVVLGDKSNHVATIHLSQMLYLWPYMLFFSFPVALPTLFDRVAVLYNEGSASIGRAARLVIIFTAMSILAATIVHYNTIVHPFTLADNRHYVFYVFRILFKHPAIKYLAAPVYIASGYVVIQALGSNGQHRKVSTQKEKQSPEMRREGCSVSFCLVWFISTALSLVTAPLVEPRYCIIPWIIWRLHVPSLRVGDSRGAIKDKGQRSWLMKLLQKDYPRLVLEAAWFCCISFVTGYMFLFRGFGWPQEPGNIQRFLW